MADTTKKAKKEFVAKGVALFIAILMSFSVALLAASGATRAQQATMIAVDHARSFQLKLYATEAARLALAHIQSQINVPTNNVEETYTIEGSTAGSFIFFPSAPGGSRGPYFGYRAKARLVGVPGEILPGMKDPLAADNYCFDILAEVRDIVPMPAGTSAPSDDVISTSLGLAWGKTKSVGMIACIPRQLN